MLPALHRVHDTSALRGGCGPATHRRGHRDRWTCGPSAGRRRPALAGGGLTRARLTKAGFTVDPDS
ncbi:hypothetical protein [Nonomuraea dietziae]|uniref:hypothetical protein n=1 Tax=Nonomuraea dietziae TaxID=65515 RepID=UPI0031DF2200